MDSAEFAEKLREWPEPNLIAALRDYRDDYDDAQVDAICQEIERRRALPPPVEVTESEEERTGRACRYVLKVAISLLLSSFLWALVKPHVESAFAALAGVFAFVILKFFVLPTLAHLIDPEPSRDG